MGSEINLVPESLVRKKGQVKNLKIFIAGSAGAFALCFVGFLAFFLLARSSELEVNLVKAEVEKKNTSIEKLKTTQDKETDLILRVAEISRTTAGRKRESIFISDLLKIVPFGITINKATIDETDKAIVGGTAVSYGTLADFLSAVVLSAKNTGSIFSDAALTEVSLKKDTGLITFSLEVFLKPGVLLPKKVLDN
ncbi:hypothetical protein COT49_02160 [candidate division WWE3 bacterium CG08_land_8_20_14_0_20_40_13]|uniref:Uncharacterized protein n=1 Tax=candidate division WWE3 bacterium CG08_land_8_20_14_0_20_40_13 TaxID=1975084 RepID=A0A2H0XDQ8_UNCKA|nr:MAG: hypothetical protein COT49_02160 [candidate division WWE3 bacterium CG08_land_8_20_14_0_20_40_13]